LPDTGLSYPALAADNIKDALVGRFSSGNRRICLVFSGFFIGQAETMEIPRTEADYSTADCGQIETRVAAFIERL